MEGPDLKEDSDEVFNKYTHRMRRLTGASEAYQSSRLYKDAIAIQNNPRKLRTAEYAALTERERVRMSTLMQGWSLASTIWPLLAGALILLFFLGPGLLAVMTLINSLNVWVFAGLIFAAVVVWRNRR